MGTADVYLRYRGAVPRRWIADTLREERRYWNREKRSRIRRYEFAAVGVADAADFIHVQGGRVIFAQEQRCRALLDREFREAWEDRDVCLFLDRVYRKYGKPYFQKLDRGPELRSPTMMSYLRGAKVIPIPSPSRYPQANGKLERANGTIKRWANPLDGSLPAREDVLAEIDRALREHNEELPKDVLGNRTPAEVYRQDPRTSIDRMRIYREWSALKDRLLSEWRLKKGSLHDGDELDAMRIAAYRILEKWNLVVYSQGSEAPEV